MHWEVYNTDDKGFGDQDLLRIDVFKLKKKIVQTLVTLLCLAYVKVVQVIVKSSPRQKLYPRSSSMDTVVQLVVQSVAQIVVQSETWIDCL